MKRRIRTSTLQENWKKLWNMKVTIIPIVIGAFSTVIKSIGRLGGWRTSGNHPNYSIIENDQNTEKSPEDLRRLKETYCHSNSCEKLSTKTDVKNSQGVNNNEEYLKWTRKLLKTIQLSANKWTLTVRSKIKSPTNYLLDKYINRIRH